MPTLKLWYFNARGNAEPIRFLLRLADVPFEDFRFTEEQWPPIKKEMPLALCPVLEVDGVKIGQSTAILRYVANEYGFAGKSNLEKAKVDMIGSYAKDLGNSKGVGDWWQVLFGIHPESQWNSESGKKEYFDKKIRPEIDTYSPIIEKFLDQNGNNGLFFGDQITWADVITAEQYKKFIDFGNPDCIDKYPKIKKLVDRIHSHPKIAEYLATRPVTVD